MCAASTSTLSLPVAVSSQADYSCHASISVADGCCWVLHFIQWTSGTVPVSRLSPVRVFEWTIIHNANIYTHESACARRCALPSARRLVLNSHLLCNCDAATGCSILCASQYGNFERWREERSTYPKNIQSITKHHQSVFDVTDSTDWWTLTDTCQLCLNQNPGNTQFRWKGGTKRSPKWSYFIASYRANTQQCTGALGLLLFQTGTITQQHRTGPVTSIETVQPARRRPSSRVWRLLAARNQRTIAESSFE